MNYERVVAVDAIALIRNIASESDVKKARRHGHRAFGFKLTFRSV
jgi:hypothetical protein